MAGNIFEYTARRDELAPEPSNRAAEAHVIAGRRIGAEYHAAGAAMQLLGHEAGSAVATAGQTYEDYQTHKEVSAGGLGIASLSLSMTNQWQDTIKNADPNDPSLQGRFLDQLEGKLQKFKETFHTEKGQDWAERQVERLRNHFTEASTADISTMAGIAAHNNVLQSLNTYTAMVDKDPSTRKLAADQWKSQIEDTIAHTPNLKGVAAAKFREDGYRSGMEQIGKAALFAAIQKGTDGREVADDPTFAPFINATDRREMVRWHDMETRAANGEARQAKMWQKQVEQDASDKSVIDFVDRVGNADRTPPTREELHEATRSSPDNKEGKPYLTRHDYEHMLGILANPPDRLKPGVATKNFSEAVQHIWNGEWKDLEPAKQLLKDGKIDIPRYKELRREFMDARDDQGQPISQARSLFLRDYGHIVNAPNMYGERFFPDREYDLYKAQLRQEEKARKATGDPMQAYDRNSEFFIGKQPEAQPLSPAQLQREHMRRLEESLKPGSAATNEAPKKPISQMSLEELREIGANPYGLTVEQRAEAKRRWEELQHGKQ